MNWTTTSISEDKGTKLNTDPVSQHPAMKDAGELPQQMQDITKTLIILWKKQKSVINTSGEETYKF